MNKKELHKIVRSVDADEWYYYFNFDGAEVKTRLKNDKTSGSFNWNDKIKPIMADIFSNVDIPYVFDIGCNMGYYAHEMTKMGAVVTGVDFNLSFAQIYRSYVMDYLGEEFDVELIEADVTKGMGRFASEGVNIITMFCVIYHLQPYASMVMEQCKQYFPSLQYVVVQGNTPRVKKKQQPLGGQRGITKFLNKHGFENRVHYKDYQKPVVVGKIA